MHLRKPDNETPDCVTASLTAKIQQLPEQLERSLTWPRTRGGQAQAVTVDTGVRSTSAIPKRSWQRGTDEHTNRLLRKYLPHGMTPSRKLSELSHWPPDTARS